MNNNGLVVGNWLNPLSQIINLVSRWQLSTYKHHYGAGVPRLWFTPKRWGATTNDGWPICEKREATANGLRDECVDEIVNLAATPGNPALDQAMDRA